jgi:hypothetical protein
MEGGGTHLFVYRHITRLGAREESILFVKEKIAANRYLNQGLIVQREKQYINYCFYKKKEIGEINVFNK